MAWLELARACLPNGDLLTLRQCGAEFEIRINLLELMTSKNAVSERALAEVACARVDAAHILIGGLGMGYTVRAVLDQVGRDAQVTVAELVPDVIAWNRGPLAELTARPLDDRRVTVTNLDVTDVIRGNSGVFDAILMDVDNGPEAVCFPSNRFLYSVEGVALVRSGLKPGGVLGVWAADRSANFEQVLERGGFVSDRVNVDIRGKDGPVHTIYLVW